MQGAAESKGGGSPESAVPTKASPSCGAFAPLARPLSTHLLSRSLWCAASQTRTWRTAPLETRAEATQARRGRELETHGGCGGCSSGLRPGEAVAGPPARARRPPPARRGVVHSPRPARPPDARPGPARSAAGEGTPSRACWVSLPGAEVRSAALLKGRRRLKGC